MCEEVCVSDVDVSMRSQVTVKIVKVKPTRSFPFLAGHG